ncbi:hypothetical protein GCM10010430_42360 [Kitasatospora cystarginea]|uniref:Uncharacterized protein n=1 Tax=Kitasatospora cystarginea TaxID=58350 RepID=A0ABP5RAN2_9ACTN
MAKTFDEYKAERRKRVPVGNPLDDYDPVEAARLLTKRGTPKDWSFCECGSEKCPDKGKADGSALAPILGRSFPRGSRGAA